MTQPFRIGGVYRQQSGDIARLLPAGMVEERECGTACCVGERVSMFTGGWRFLDNGRYVNKEDVANYAAHLIPGELELRDGEWRPIEAAPSLFAVLRGEPTWTFSTDSATTQTVVVCAADAAMIARDGPQRPAQAVIPTAPAFDAFPGFEVKKSFHHWLPGEEAAQACNFSSPLQRMSGGGHLLGAGLKD